MVKIPEGDKINSEKGFWHWWGFLGMLNEQWKQERDGGLPVNRPLDTSLETKNLSRNPSTTVQRDHRSKGSG